MQTTVIVASYNQPKGLALGLHALAMQSKLDFDVIIADDGSAPDVGEMVAQFAKTAPFSVTFLTQEDAGFCKPTIFNKAILASRGEKIIFLDGDCVPFADHVEMHASHLKPGYFCVGGRVFIPLEDTLKLTPQEIETQALRRFVTPEATAFLRSMHRTSVLQSFLGMNRGPRIIGCNCSFMREDLFKVNGYDETFNNQGKEDSDLRNRLRNNGVKGISLLTKNIVCHLDHGLDKKSKNSTNKRVKDVSYYISRKKALTAAKGLNELLCQTK